MPLDVALLGPGGEVVDHVQRGADGALARVVTAG
jgi:hypothetical protein